MLKRVPNQLIFVSIQNADTDYNDLSGKYFFHSVKNNAPAFVREEGQLENFDFHPYYLAFYSGSWFIQGTDSFDNNRSEGWIFIDTKGWLPMQHRLCCTTRYFWYLSPAVIFITYNL